MLPLLWTKDRSPHECGGIKLSCRLKQKFIKESTTWKPRNRNKLVFYKRYLNHGNRTVEDLRFDLNNIDFFELLVKHIEKTNILEWTVLHHSVPIDLRNTYYIQTAQTEIHPLQLTMAFSMLLKRNQRIITFFVRKIARLPNIAQKLKCEFTLSDETLKKAFSPPHSVTFVKSRPFSSRY